MATKSAAIISVLLAALCVNTCSTYAGSFAYSAPPYSEMDSIEQMSSESAYPASYYHDDLASATSANSNSDEDSTYRHDGGEEEEDADVDFTIEYPAFNGVDDVTTPYPVQVHKDPGHGAISYTTVAYPTHLYNQNQMATTSYSTPDYSNLAYTSPTLDVPVFRAPTLLPYWMRSGYPGNTVRSHPSY